MQSIPFIRDAMPKPASEQSAQGQDIERPFGERFGPDDAMYVTDYGVARANVVEAGLGDLLFKFVPQSGAIWKVTKVQ
jgi:hypothetical protein